MAAQLSWLERPVHTRQVVGSNLTAATKSNRLKIKGPLVKRLRHRPFTAVTRVRISQGSPRIAHTLSVCVFSCFPLRERTQFAISEALFLVLAPIFRRVRLCFQPKKVGKMNQNRHFLRLRVSIFRLYIDEIDFIFYQC